MPGIILAEAAAPATPAANKVAVYAKADGLIYGKDDAGLETKLSNDSGLAVASQADQEAASSITLVVTPGRQQYHPSAAKAWVAFNGVGAIAIGASYNVSSITDGGVGVYTVNFATSFSSANYAASLASISLIFATASNTAAACPISCTNSAFAPVDSGFVGATFFGDQA